MQPVEGGVRIEVSDDHAVAPVLGMRGAEGMTGRGLRMVAGIASHWGVELTDSGKVVWAQLTDEAPIAQAYSEGDLVAMWGDDLADQQAPVTRYHLELGEVPTDLLVAAKSHVDNVVRELMLATSARTTG